jgi:hypothetical protein
MKHNWLLPTVLITGIAIGCVADKMLVPCKRPPHHTCTPSHFFGLPSSPMRALALPTRTPGTGWRSLPGGETPIVTHVILSAGLALALCLATVVAEGPADAQQQAVPSPERSGVAEIPEDLVLPRRLNQVEVRYPPELLDRDVPPSGTLIVDFVVDVHGATKDLELRGSLDPAIDEAVRQAIASLRYEPATYQGQAVEVAMSIEVRIEPPQVEPALAEEEVEEADDDQDLPVRIRGRILEAGRRVPLAKASVLALPAGDRRPGLQKKLKYEPIKEPAWQSQAITDDKGRFELRGIPDGRVLVVVLLPGFERYEHVHDLGPGAVLKQDYYVKRSREHPYRTVVRQERDRSAPPARHVVGREELRALPGSLGDAFKGLENLPGVGQTPLGLSRIVIRGTQPRMSSVFLGPHEIPRAYHFLGLTSVYPTGALERLDLVSSNFGPRYGDTIGGLITMTPRAPDPDRLLHGYVDLNPLDASAQLRGPIGKKTRFLAGFRRSYVDAIIAAIEAGLPGDNLPKPNYTDYQAMGTFSLGAHELSIRALGSHDTVRLEQVEEVEGEEPEEVEFRFTDAFHRADLEWATHQGKWTLLASPSYRFEISEITAGGIVPLSFTTRAHVSSNRVEMRRKIARRGDLLFGADLVYRHYTKVEKPPPSFDIFSGGLTPEPDPDYPDEDIPSFIQDSLPDQLELGAYAAADVAVGSRIRLAPGLRLSYFKVPGRVSADPRTTMKAELGEKTALRLGAGLYSQAPAVEILDPEHGEPDLRLERSAQTGIAFERQLPWKLSVELSPYYTYMWNLAVPASRIASAGGGVAEGERATSSGEAHIHGVELMLRRHEGAHYFGWLAYTFIMSRVRDFPAGNWELENADQNHVLILLGGIKLQKRWVLSGRFRLFTGLCGDTQLDGGGDYHFCAPDYPGSTDLGVYHELDLRLEKTWVYRRYTFALYLNLKNAYNRRNTQVYTDYGPAGVAGRLPIPGLPLLPVMGLRGEF